MKLVKRISEVSLFKSYDKWTSGLRRVAAVWVEGWMLGIPGGSRVVNL